MIAREQLEMLLMDRSLGGCTPEVAALLEAYLEKDAEARAEAERWGRLVGQARLAMAGERAELPPFPRERFLRRERMGRLWRIGGAVSAIAACLVAGVMAGASWNAGGKAPVTQAVVKGPETEPTEPAAAVEDFWSVARIERSARQNRAGGGGPARPAGFERFNYPFGGVR